MIQMAALREINSSAFSAAYARAVATRRVLLIIP
jgi:hypothetical protein